MVNILQPIAQSVDGNTTNPDVKRFRRVASGTWLVVAVVLIFVGWAWRNQSELIFALPAFPQMTGCDTFGDRENPPDVVDLFRSRNGDNDDEAFDLAFADCRYNENLSLAYNTLKAEMLKYAIESDVEQISQQARSPGACPSPHELQVGGRCLSIDADTGKVFDWQMMQLSIEAMVRTLAMVIGFVGTFIYAVWGGTATARASRELYTRGGWRYIRGGMLAVVICALAYVSIDVVWFMFGRVVPTPVLYPLGTSVLFTGLVLGVLFFFVMLAVSEIRIEAMSVFATIVLTLGLIAGILTTNHVWDSGQTNAYSAMSEHAYGERLAFNVAGDLGSRRIFRVTLIASGILLMTYAIQLHFVVRTLKEDPVYHRKPENATLLRPRWIAFFGTIAGLLTTLVGWFPTDGTFIPNPYSTILHMLGAFGGPMLMLVMMITLWFIGHPIDSAYVPRLNLTSLNTVTIFSIAVIMHLFGYRQAMQHPLWLGVTIGFIVFLFGIFQVAQRWHRDDLSPHGNGWQGLNHSIVHWIFIVVIGLVLGFVFPDVMTTVTLEFGALVTFSLFIYAYSLYTSEFMDIPVFSDGSNESDV